MNATVILTFIGWIMILLYVREFIYQRLFVDRRVNKG